MNSEGKTRNVAVVAFNKALLCCINDVCVFYIFKSSQKKEGPYTYLLTYSLHTTYTLKVYN